MKTLLESLRGKTVSVFCQSISGASMHITGTLIGGDLPGRPYGVINNMNDQNRIIANISFEEKNVRGSQIRENQNILILE